MKKLRFLLLINLLFVGNLNAQLINSSTPYSTINQEDIRIFNVKDSVYLGATLSKPANISSQTPVIVMITGSGPQDRDEAIGNKKPFKTIAEYLSNKGYAVLRYDDRGFGKSTGKAFPNQKIQDYVNDVESCVEYLRKEKHFNKVGLLGHSEGGVVASILARKDRNISFLISLASPMFAFRFTYDSSK